MQQKQSKIVGVMDEASFEKEEVLTVAEKKDPSPQFFEDREKNRQKKILMMRAKTKRQSKARSLRRKKK